MPRNRLGDVIEFEVGVGDDTENVGYEVVLEVDVERTDVVDRHQTRSSRLDRVRVRSTLEC